MKRMFSKSGREAFTRLMPSVKLYSITSWFTLYGHENEMYKEPMNLKRRKGVYMRELREYGGRTEDKTKCAKG